MNNPAELTDEKQYLHERMTRNKLAKLIVLPSALKGTDKH